LQLPFVRHLVSTRHRASFDKNILQTGRQRNPLYNTV